MKPRNETLMRALSAAIAISLWAAPGLAGEVTLDTDVGCYEVGDTVSFTFTNGLNDTIWTPHSPPWAIWDASVDTLIYPSLAFWVVTPLDASSSLNFSWDQDDYLFHPVSTGTYWVKISYSEALDPWSLNTLIDTFEISDSCGTTATLQTSWSMVKKLFH